MSKHKVARKFEEFIDWAFNKKKNGTDNLVLFESPFLSELLLY